MWTVSDTFHLLSRNKEEFILFFSLMFLFWHSGEWGSQWHIAPFEEGGAHYNCSEQYMMAQKALLFNDLATHAAIMTATSPSKQKALGRKVRGFDEKVWAQHRYQIVLKANLAKFRQNPELKKHLLATGNLTIAEASPHDKLWGIGLRASDPRSQNKERWLGQNLLGQVLMEVRQILQE